MPDDPSHDSNPFEQLARQQMRRKTWEKALASSHKAEAKKYASDADAPMVPGKQEKKQRDEARQVRAYKRWKRAEIRTLLEGPHRIPWLTFSRMLRQLTLEDPQPLIDYVERAAWLRDADQLTRYIALAAISQRIVKLRIQNGYPPFDDSLPNEPPTAFEVVREMLSPDRRR